MRVKKMGRADARRWRSATSPACGSPVRRPLSQPAVGGQQQRAAIARALCMGPGVMLLTTTAR
jgi:ABC-type polar amino acid transport system ATPase subunit